MSISSKISQNGCRFFYFFISRTVNHQGIVELGTIASQTCLDFDYWIPLGDCLVWLAIPYHKRLVFPSLKIGSLVEVMQKL